jgi:hypothetical protein
LFSLLPGQPAPASPKPEIYWQVDDVKAGMKGVGRTVMKGTKVESFDCEVLGVLKNTSPGRDLVLCRLSGLNLEKTGVIAGMSGSPIYIKGKLLGAVAYAWAFGKEPLAGVTPFCQMHGFVESYERRDLTNLKANRIGLLSPLKVGEQEFKTVTVAQDFDDPQPVAADGLWMTPLRTPLMATGFTPHSLKLLGRECRGFGLVPMQGGGVTAKVAEQEKNAPLEPGSPLVVAMIRGDFDLSGIGTVTHVEGKRVYGFGHPMLGIGSCEFPLMTGYIHAICPRQSISFKMGSPLQDVGVINADVSTCIAGWLGRKADMLPVRMKVRRETEEPRTFNVEVARQRSLQSALVLTALTNSVDMEGDLPEEMTADLKATIELEDREPIVIEDTFSGASYSGGRAPQNLYSQIGAVVSLLTFNPHAPVRIKKIDCCTNIRTGRRSAEIEGIDLETETYLPGETLKANVFIKPYKGPKQRVPVSLKLPADLPVGRYSVNFCDDLSCARAILRENPTLGSPQNLDQLLRSIKVLTSVKRSNLVARVALPAAGVAVGGKALAELPPSMVQILGNTRRTGAQSIGGSLIARQATDWIILGSESVPFEVVKSKKVLAPQ